MFDDLYQAPRLGEIAKTAGTIRQTTGLLDWKAVPDQSGPLANSAKRASNQTRSPEAEQRIRAVETRYDSGHRLFWDWEFKAQYDVLQT